MSRRKGTAMGPSSAGSSNQLYPRMPEEVRKIGVEETVHRLDRLRLAEPKFADVLETTFDETIDEHGVERSYATKSRINSKLNSDEQTIKDHLQNDQYLYKDAPTDPYSVGAELGAIDLYDHLNGEYRLRGRPQYQRYLHEQIDGRPLTDGYVDLAPPDNRDYPLLYDRMIAHGLRILWGRRDRLKQDYPQKYEMVKGEIPEALKQASPKEIDITVLLQHEMDIRMENVSFEFRQGKNIDGNSDLWSALYVIRLVISKYQNESVEELTEYQWNQLHRDLDASVETVLKYLITPMMREANCGRNCSCKSASEHISRSSDDCLNLSLLQEQYGRREYYKRVESNDLPGEFCNKAWRDSFTKTPNVSQSGGIVTEYRCQMNDLEYESPSY